MKLSEQVIQQFFRKFHHSPTHIIRAPGRVNLIGEHTDYNDGFVLPLAIDQALVMAIRPRDDRFVEVFSLDLDSTTAFGLSDFSEKGVGWGEYLKATSWALIEHGYNLKGWEGVLASDIPIAAGLSSSAALEMATIKAFEVVSNFAWDPIKLAKIGQFGENHWVGVNSGIMDQLVIAVGRQGYAVMIDCRSLEYTPVAIPDAVRIVIFDSNTRRDLVDSSYNERRQQCEQAAHFFGLSSLRDLDTDELDQAAEKLPLEVYRRARHVLSENNRVKDAYSAMQKNDSARLGAILCDGHLSLRDDFAISRLEIDTLVEIASSYEHCYGARMTGGGFGGCIVSLVDPDAVQAFIETTTLQYKKETGLEAKCYSTSAQDGVSVHPHREVNNTLP